MKTSMKTAHQNSLPLPHLKPNSHSTQQKGKNMDFSCLPVTLSIHRKVKQTPPQLPVRRKLGNLGSALVNCVIPLLRAGCCSLHLKPQAAGERRLCQTIEGTTIEERTGSR